jgi:hypothetical protein
MRKIALVADVVCWVFLAVFLVGAYALHIQLVCGIGIVGIAVGLTIGATNVAVRKQLQYEAEKARKFAEELRKGNEANGKV